MRTVPLILTILTILLIAGLANWVRQGDSFHIARALPFCSGRPPGLYDLAGIVMILILLAGLRRLLHPREDEEE